VIYEALEGYIEKQELSKNKMIAFGSDGASVLTGKKNGVGVQLQTHVNELMIHIHCMAHRLNLVTSKAAENVTFITDTIQKAMSDLFYYLHKSAVRTSNLVAVQKLLSLPELKIKKIHKIRWFSFYDAMHTIYMNWAPIVVFLKTEKPKAALEICNKMLDVKFVYTLHLLMDILPSFAALNMQFQKKDLDSATIQPSINYVLQVLTAVRKGTSHYVGALKNEMSKIDVSVEKK
jgi:hypothetical protein